MGNKNHKWRYLNTGENSGAYNMALDQVLVQSVASGSSLPIIRFFAWNPPAVSLGYNQSVEDIDHPACRRLGLDIVRRPTGGRAVIHQNEFTYSVIAPQDDPVVDGTIMETYQKIAGGLLAGLKGLGAEAQMAKSSVPAMPAHGSALCFAAAGRYEITAGGKKLIGSAQRRISSVILQQGSLLLSCNQGEEIFRSNQGRAEAGTLYEVLNRFVSFGEVALKMEFGFRESWGITLLEAAISSEEQRAAKEQSAKYDLNQK